MSLKFQDYYETLGVARAASADEIQRAYRKLARKYHPDINKEKGSEDRFKQLGEAYEVLKDPEKRARYDQLGANYKAGQDFRPPPGYEHFFQGGSAHAGGDQFSFGGFSDFFEALFGGAAGATRGGAQFNPYEDIDGSAFRTSTGGARRHANSRASAKETAAHGELTISLEEALRGTTRQLSLNEGNTVRTLDVKIPAGTIEGGKVRLGGASGAGRDVILEVHLAPHPRFQASGHDLTTKLALAPWEAALGAKVAVPLLGGGEVRVSVPAGSDSDQRLRLKGKGLPRRSGAAGDLIVELQIVVPKNLSAPEREMFEKLQHASTFKPRG